MRITEQQKEIILKMVYAMEEVVEACSDDEVNMFLAYADVFKLSLDEVAYKLESLAIEAVEGIEVDK